VILPLPLDSEGLENIVESERALAEDEKLVFITRIELSSNEVPVLEFHGILVYIQEFLFLEIVDLNLIVRSVS
jgi:hypothetical protein